METAKIKVGEGSNTIKDIGHLFAKLHKENSKMEDIDNEAEDNALTEQKGNNWKNLVANDFNFLIYGIGSKLTMMKILALDYLSEVGDVIFVNGATATVSIKQILAKICVLVAKKCCDGIQSMPGRQIDQLVWLEETLKSEEASLKIKKIILVLHCLDVIVGTDIAERNSLAWLAKIKKIR